MEEKLQLQILSVTLYKDTNDSQHFPLHVCFDCFSRSAERAKQFICTSDNSLSAGGDSLRVDAVMYGYALINFEPFSLTVKSVNLLNLLAVFVSKPFTILTPSLAHSASDSLDMRWHTSGALLWAP